MIEEYKAQVTDFLGAQAIEDAKKHAVRVFPQESCGFIASGVYVACENSHPTPATHFRIEDPRYDAAVIAGTIEAVVHSHPNGPIFPSQMDMAQQLQCAVPFVIITLNEDRVSDVVAWGANLPVAPVIGRPFLHGVLDCYSLIRDVYRLGRDELLKQGVHWPLSAIELPEVARDDNWWANGDDLYSAHFEKFGFSTISRDQARAGDIFLVAIGDRRTNPKNQLNHGGLLLEYEQILHHLPTRLSNRIPAGLWARAADLWIRYEGATS